MLQSANTRFSQFYRCSSRPNDFSGINDGFSKSVLAYPNLR